MVNVSSTGGPGVDACRWLVDQFVTANPAARHALAVTADGAVAGASAGLDPVTTAQLSGVLAQATEWTNRAAACVRGPMVVSCLLTESGEQLLVVPIPGGGALAVVADGATDPGQVGYEAVLAAGRLGQAMAAGERVGLPAR